MLQFLWGALAMASLTAMLFFLRFRRDTGDGLFGFFAAAFGVFAVHWTVLGLGLVSRFSEHMPLVYAMRLLAFGLIMVGIVHKNRGR